jgi:hypothetical protein
VLAIAFLPKRRSRARRPTDRDGATVRARPRRPRSPRRAGRCVADVP